MKRITITLAVAMMVYSAAVAQVPQAFNYTGFATNKNGNSLSHKAISIRAAIVDGSKDGPRLYEETHESFTDHKGFFNIKVGRGNPTLGVFSEIDWSGGPKYLSVEIKPHGFGYYRYLGSVELLSVPFALFAGSTLDADDADTDPENEVISNTMLNGAILEITEGETVTHVDLSSLAGGNEDADADPQNELQTLSIVGNKLVISNGNEVDLPAATSGGEYYFYDGDGDMYGDPTRPVWVVTTHNPPEGFINTSGDCNDLDAAINPDATEMPDGIDNNCDGQTDDLDSDDDGIVDFDDNCPLVSNIDQADNENDGIGDVCDANDDNDNLPDDLDNCPFVSNANQNDNDNDDIGDVCDEDDDNDGVLDNQDNCSLVANPDQGNNDNDTFGDACDADDDNDGDPDATDCAPFDPAIRHNRTEAFNGVDDNCNSYIDDVCVEANDGNDVCSSAQFIGTVADDGSDLFQNGKLTTKQSLSVSGVADEDWYRIRATDETDFIVDNFNLVIQLNSSLYRMDIYKDNCGNLIASDVSSYEKGGTVNDDTADYYIRVYAVTPANLCQTYSLNIVNGD